MATTLVISPTTNTMLKTVLYSGYLNPSFLMHELDIEELLYIIIISFKIAGMGSVCYAIALQGKVFPARSTDHEWIMKKRTVQYWEMLNPLEQLFFFCSTRRCILLHVSLPFLDVISGVTSVEKTPPRGQRSRLECLPLPLPCLSARQHPTS